MSNTQNTDRKSAVSTLRFAIVPLVKDSGEELTYGSVYEINNNLITAKYTPKMNSASQFASGTEVDSYVAKAGGTLDITICGTTEEDEVKLFGSALDANTGVLKSNKSDVVPDNMVIYSTERSDGTINLYKFPKAKFTSQGETAQTKDNNGVTYNTVALQANYKATLNNGDDMYCIKGVDTTTQVGRELETAWFGSALGGTPTGGNAESCTITITGATNADYITKGGIKVSTGAVVPKGKVLSVVITTENTVCTVNGATYASGDMMIVNSDTTIAFTND